MSALRVNNINSVPKKGTSVLIPIGILWGLAIFLGAGFLWFTGAFSDSLESLYLIPWVAILGLIVVAPSIYLIYIGKFDLFHPLVFAAWSYVFPAFVIGGVLLNLDLVDWYFLSFIEDPRYNIPLTVVYIAIGFLGLIAGYYLPVGRLFAEALEKRLPAWDWKPDHVWNAGILLLLIGVGANALAFIQGLVGYQRAEAIDVFDGLISFLLIVLTAGTVLLWLAIFSTDKRTGIYYLVLALLIVFVPIRMALLGSRSSLVIGLIPIIFAYTASGRKFKLKPTIVFATLAIAGVFIGVVYGTTFRKLKGSETRMKAGDYFGQVIATVDFVTSQNPGVIFEDGLQALAQRVENLSSVAVVVSNYEKLAPYEESYGLQNNILNDFYTSFIPRFVWPDKPSTSDPRAYSELYFDFGNNSFAISPFGDLLRNFGPIGVPLGMLILGIYLRLIYAMFIETKFPAMWKKVAYFLLLTCISYEAFYGPLFPTVIRTTIVLAVCLSFANLFARQGRLKGMART